MISGTNSNSDFFSNSLSGNLLQGFLHRFSIVNFRFFLILLIGVVFLLILIFSENVLLKELSKAMLIFTGLCLFRLLNIIPTILNNNIPERIRLIDGQFTLVKAKRIMLKILSNKDQFRVIKDFSPENYTGEPKMSRIKIDSMTDRENKIFQDWHLLKN